MILTIDLGTTATKAAFWTESGMVAIGRGPVATQHPSPGWAEQDAESWWGSVVRAVRALGPRGDVAVIAFSGARQTFVPVTASGAPLGRAILWSDRRAGSGSVLAKLQWLEGNAPDRLAAARWLLSPRDLVAWRMGGEVRTDWTMASASGLYAADGSVIDAAAPFTGMLPDAVPSATVVGGLAAEPASELRLQAGIPLVIGAGDRQCEVVGTGASPAMPMVSWGTTANVSMPVDAPRAPSALLATRGALHGWLLEGGVSAAGSLLEWLSRVTGASADALMDEAAGSAPGARGVLALPWLGGARAPWWREDAGAAFLGLGPGHDRADLARAVLEGVAFDIRRCLEAMDGSPRRLVLAGGGGGSGLWAGVLSGVTALPVVHRRWSEAASAGAALVAAVAVPVGALQVDGINPVIDESPPDPSAVEVYERLRVASDRAARAVLE